MAPGAAGSPTGGGSDVDTSDGGGSSSRFPVVATIKSALSPLWSESAQWDEKWIPPKSALIAWCGAAALTAAGTFSAVWALRWYRRRRAGGRSALPISTKGGHKAVTARGAGTRRPLSVSAGDAQASFSQSRRGGDTASKRYSVGGSSPAPKLIELDMSPKELLAETEAVMGEERALADHIASLFTYIRAGAVLLEPPLDFAHTFQLLADIEAKHAVRRSSLTFPGYVSPHAELREASVTAQKSLAKHDIELGTRADVYRVLKAIAEEYEEQLADALRRQQASPAEEEAANKRDRQHDPDGHSRAEGRRARDAFDRHTAAAAQAAAACGLSLEHVRYMRYTIRDYERLGMHLDDTERERFVALRTRISDLCIEYQRNLNEEDTRVWFRADQLAGMSASFLAGLRQRRNAQRPEEAEYEVTLKYPHYFPLMKHCRVEETRRLMERLFNSRCVPENVALLEEAVKLRDDAAKLLGYSSHAAYVLDTRMAGSPATVTQFLRRISKRMERAAQTELAELRRLKRRELVETGAGRHLSGGTAEIDDRLFMWDLRYYMTRYEQQRFQIDHEAVSEYFPLDRVVSGMFQIYQDLLALRFVELPDAPRWHEEVRAFAVRDGSSAQLMGYFYLDLHPREGKYGHAAVWPLQPGCVAPEAVGSGTERGANDTRLGWKVNLDGVAPATPRGGGNVSATSSSGHAAPDAATAEAMGMRRLPRQAPVAAMVANFSKPTAEQPSLLRHEEVVTLFHEFGHVMHHICSRARFARFSGTRVERDFVEAPSQMLENWCWEHAALTKLSGHYRRFVPRSASGGGGLVPEPLPEDTVRRMRDAKRCMAALLTRRQVVLSLFDQELHHRAAAVEAASEIDSAAVLERLQRSIGLVPMTPGTHFGGSFGHLMGGYDAQYYGYLWSEVFSCDMYETGFGGEPLNADAGRRYRQCILTPGGSRDAADMLREFLGREPREQAFLRSKGVA